MKYEPSKIAILQAEYYTKKLTDPEPWRDLQFCEWMSDGKGRVREQWRDVAREPTWLMAEYRWRPEADTAPLSDTSNLKNLHSESSDYPLDGKSEEQELEEEIQRHNNHALFKKALDEPSKKNTEELARWLR